MQGLLLLALMPTADVAYRQLVSGGGLQRARAQAVSAPEFFGAPSAKCSKLRDVITIVIC